MAAITWKNPTGASLAAPTLANPLKGMFDGLNGVMQDYQNNQETILNKGREANYSAYLGELDKITTPEQMIERKDFLANMRSGFDAQTIDKLRGADVSREDYLLNRSDLAHTRNRLNQERDAESIFSGFSQALSNNDFQVAGEQIDFMPEHVKAKAYGQLNTAKQAKVTADVAAENLGYARQQRANLAELTPGAQVLALAKQKADISDVEQTGVAKNIFAQEYKKFQDQEASNKSVFASILADPSAKGIPIGKDGFPDEELMTPSQGNFLKDQLAKGGFKEFSSSAAMDSLKKSLIASGVSPDKVAANTANFGGLVNSQGTVSPEAKLEADTKIAAITAANDKAKKESVFFSDPKTLVQDKLGVLGKARTLMKDGDMTVTTLTDQMGNWMNGGFPLEINGKTTMTAIPPRVIDLALMAGLESDTWMDNDTDKNMIAHITTLMTDPNTAEERKWATYLNGDGHLHEIKSIKDGLTRNTGTTTTSDYLKRFNLRIGTPPNNKGGSSGKW